MVENFSGNNDSSIFVGKVRPEDLAAEQKLNELKGAADEIAKKIALKKVELEREACSHVDVIFSQVELHVEKDEDYFTSGIDSLLKGLCKLLEPLVNEFDVDVDPKIYEMLKEKKEKSRLLSMLKFLRDKLKELIKKVFSRDLSFDQRLDKEIKELEEKLFGGGLSKEEEIAILERLEALRGLKLKLQMFLVGWVITTLAEIFAVNLMSSIETGTSKEEDRKAKETSSKEASKEVCEGVEIKMDEREKPKPISLFDFSPGFARPIPLTKPESDLLPKPLKDLMHPVHERDISKKNSRVKETKVEEEKKAKSEEPKVAVCPPATKKPEMRQGREKVYGCDSSKKRKMSRDSNNICKQASNQSAQGSVPNGKVPERPNKASGSTSGKSAQESASGREVLKRSVADYEYDFTVGFWNGPEDEPQKSSVNNAQPTSEFNDVKITGGQSVGKTVSGG